VTIIDFGRAIPSPQARGWQQWPGHEDFSLQFLRVLRASQEGGSTVSECFLAAERINPRDDESWYREWKSAADINRKRAAEALASGRIPTALSNWLRAANYYRTAQVMLACSDSRQGEAIASMQDCARLYVQHGAPAGEVVEIPWRDSVLQGYFLPAPRVVQPSPVVLCVVGQGHYKEEHLHRVPSYALERGLSLLLVDLPNQSYGQAPSESRCRYDVETAISVWVDFLTERSDLDENRIAIFGDGLGAAFATRGANLDDRFAAAVCDAGIWELHERAFIASRISGKAGLGCPSEIEGFSSSSVAANIKCPVLVAMGERDWLDVDHVTECCRVMKQNGLDIELKIFRTSETVAPPAQIDNPTVGNEFIFDWIVDRLGSGT
jgi:dienelactone hydrolase